MIGKKELVISNLYRYFYAITEREKVEQKLIVLERSVDVRSPKFDSEPVGYSLPRDNKLAEYSRKKSKLEDEIKSWESESQVYYNILHLYELEESDIEFLSLLYKEKLKYEEIAKRLFYTDKSYVSRKKENLLERLSKYLWPKTNFFYKID